MGSYIVRCDDADPESTCAFSAEGTSVDETYQKFMAHAQTTHADQILGMSPQQLQEFEDKVTAALQSQKHAAPIKP